MNNWVGHNFSVCEVVYSVYCRHCDSYYLLKSTANKNNSFIVRKKAFSCFLNHLIQILGWISFNHFSIFQFFNIFFFFSSCLASILALWFISVFNVYFSDQKICFGLWLNLHLFSGQLILLAFSSLFCDWLPLDVWSLDIHRQRTFCFESSVYVNVSGMLLVILELSINHAHWPLCIFYNQGFSYGYSITIQASCLNSQLVQPNCYYSQWTISYKKIK